MRPRMVTAAAPKNFFGTFDLQTHRKNNNNNHII